MQVEHKVHDLGWHRDDSSLAVLADGVRDEDCLFADVDVGEFEHGYLLGADEHVVQEVADEQEVPVVFFQPVVQAGHGGIRDYRPFLADGIASECFNAFCGTDREVLVLYEE